MNELFTYLHIPTEMQKYVSVLLSVTSIVIFFYSIRFVLKTIILKIISKLVRNTKTFWDDIILERNTFNRISYLIPGIITLSILPSLESYLFDFYSIIYTIIQLYIIAFIALTIDSFLNACHDIYLNYEISKQRPIKSYIQLVKIIIYFISGIIFLSIIFDKSVVYFFSGLGALAAVLLLVFKDSILGLVAGVQLSTNDMLKVGDWITIPGKNADGDVIEITLHTVKIQNFDKTITTIPTYTLVSDSFQNWRGMQNAGGRRIKRSLKINMKTVRLLTQDDIDRLKNIQILNPYLEEKEQELANYNTIHNTNPTSKVNGRSLTNIGSFRKYIELYLKSHTAIKNDMTLLVRQLQPQNDGLPIEIYTFTNTTVWADYESIQSDIFDHLLAVIHEFDLSIFQLPSGHDLANLHIQS